MSKTAVLAYSGGLDTTCIIAWLKEFYDYDEVVAVLCDVGQEFDLEQSQERGYAAGADDVLLVDRREAFANDAVRAGAEDERALRGQVPARLRALPPGDRGRRSPSSLRSSAPRPPSTAAPARATTSSGSSSRSARTTRACA